MEENRIWEQDLLKAMNEANQAEGGTAVPVPLANQFVGFLREASIGRKLFRVVRMTSNVQDFPTTTSGASKTWTAENITGAESTPGTGKITLTAKKLRVKVYTSTELLEDSNPDVAQEIVRIMADEMAFGEDDAFFNGEGSGDTDNGELSGIRDTTTYTSINTVDAVGADGDDITTAKISLAAQKVWAATKGRISATEFVCNSIIVHKLRTLEDANSRPIFDEATFGSPILRDGAIGTIYGLKVFISEILPTNLTKGSGTSLTDCVVMNGKEGAFIGDRRRLTFERDKNFELDQWRFYANERVAFRARRQEAITIIKDIITL